ncbi:glycosyl hydrolase 2 galactose-binding domain-containing protein [Pseudoxanthomonas sp. GW2]|uniref:glycosyl hydrolase 2 galactose-binding domain-containing protein n=1 Tax=Pseudoxanthomonas sp. GW2 TaxID=1211114 RepID=UPI000A0461E3|nr:sugar-binding domain-containing protein [Pseudoxanthomonas sp. GW2]
MRSGRLRAAGIRLALALGACLGSEAAAEGPWNVEAIAGGTGWERQFADPAEVAAPGWTLRAWVRPSALPEGRAHVAGVGGPTGAAYHLCIDGRAPALCTDSGVLARGRRALEPGRWHAMAAVIGEGRAALYVDGRLVSSAALPGPVEPLEPRLSVALAGAGQGRYAGRVAGLVFEPRVLQPEALAAAFGAAPDDGLARYEPASPSWPTQTRQQIGQATPQPPATLPRSRAPAGKPRPVVPAERQGLRAAGEGVWILDDWSLAAARDLGAGGSGAVLSRDPINARGWLPATVPGTVLTTLVDRGVYPDPDHGLDNIGIPEALNRQDWWYRSAFEVPAELEGRHLRLRFNGINYAGEVWLNGERIGDTRGAFIRGEFDVTAHLRPGQRNVVAVRVSPPPHPGLPHEQSLSAGVGENGGMLVLDGPTFVASEGWDWIPAVRDRNTGLWQDVRLLATGPAWIGDAWVSSTVEAGHAAADLAVEVPLHNDGGTPVQAELELELAEVRLQTTVAIPPGGTRLRLDPARYPQLRIRQPRLWWPNGYGEPALHTLHLRLRAGDAPPHERSLRFGIREVSYELSLLDGDGNLRRVEYRPARAPGQRVVDVRHEAIRKVPGGWAQSLLPGALESPAVAPLEDARLSPHLVLRVNGVRIAVKGGNWGMDDWRKRSSRQRLEPYFRLQRDAHMNVVRNWVGQSTQESLYELADEYGMLVFNDFWASTQDYNQQPEDEALFLRNAADVIRRYRHHPSIVLWFGRNEGVPQPLLNQGLDELVHSLDGSRLYMGSSNEVNLAGSGPYDYREPEAYFTSLARGFSVEVGTPSFATLEALEAMLPEADRWPISDAWAYHDWHQSGNGDTGSFMRALERKLGPARDLADFERKAQLLNYETHRAIFEGFNAHLWTANSGRLLWMSHPAWPSLMWQIYSHDYDTHAAYYGARKAAEPLHVQMNLPDRGLAVVNASREDHRGLRVQVQAWALDGRPLGQGEAIVDAPAGQVVPASTALDLAALLWREQVAIIVLQLLGSDGGLLTDNVYWSAATADELRRLDGMPQVALQVEAKRGDGQLTLQVRNPSSTPVLGAKLTLVDAGGARILPAYYSDNYLNLAPGQARGIRIELPADAPLDGASVRVRGWNVAAGQVPVPASAHTSTAIQGDRP